MSNRTVVVSDIHMGAVPEANERSFLSFLDEVDRWGDDLLINGDLFDFWFEYTQVIPRGQLPVLARLRRLADDGMRIRFVGGNHDAWGGSFLREEVGVEVVEGPVKDTVGGRVAYIAHGDGLGGGDVPYQVLKWATRSRLGRGFFRWLHPDLAIPLARRASRTERAVAAGPGGKQARAERLGAYAKTVLDTYADVQLVLFGHAHHPELTEVAPDRFYLNSGDWLFHNSFAVVTPDSIRLESYSA